MPGDAALDDALERLRRLDREKERLFGRLAAGERRFRGLARSVWNVQEDERRRLARELHDGVGQTLTALRNELELVRRSAGNLPPEAAQRLDLASELAGQALADTREMSRLLRPQMLDDLGLEPALRWLCRALEERSGVTVRLEIDLSHPLTSELETLAFRVIQEATNNAEKHAEADRIEVVVVADSALRIRVADDGKGFSPDAAVLAAGSGLSGLRDRLVLFGGRLTVESEAGDGVRLRAVVPLDDPAAEDGWRDDPEGGR